MEVLVEDTIIDVKKESDAEYNDNSHINVNKNRWNQGFGMKIDDLWNDDEKMQLLFTV